MFGRRSAKRALIAKKEKLMNEIPNLRREAATKFAEAAEKMAKAIDRFGRQELDTQDLAEAFGEALLLYAEALLVVFK